MVLSVGKLGAGRSQLAYYEEQVAAGIEDYYAGRGEAPGPWRGPGVGELGVAAGWRVARDALMALMHGRHPVSGAQLRRMGACSTVAALDLTFSAPKSLSVLMAIGDDELASALVRAHERTVDEALGYLRWPRSPPRSRRGRRPRSSKRSWTATSPSRTSWRSAARASRGTRVIGQHQPALADEQATVVRAIAGSGRGVEAVQALAGTGKTTLLAAVAACYRHARYRVIGAAPTARAARQLRDTAGIPATTMHALLSELDRAGGFAARTVVLLDEAGMAPTRLTAALFAHAERAGAKLIAVGDPGQLRSVPAGGWLAALAGQRPELALREVIRQRDPAERDALQALHDGHPERYLAHKDSHIAVHAHEHDAIHALLEQWLLARASHGALAVAMITRDNQTRELLNRLARERLQAEHDLPVAGAVIGGRSYAVDDRVIARRNARQLQVDNGTLATVVAIDPAQIRVQIAPRRRTPWRHPQWRRIRATRRTTQPR